jgi:hypothetical protein
MKLINLQAEYNELHQVVTQFFDGTNFPEFDTFLKDVFNLGLAEAQFWVEESIIKQFLLISGKEDTHHNLVKEREDFLDETHSISSCFDAFCLIDNHFRFGILALHRGEEFNFDYTQNARDIAALMLSKYPSKSIMSLLPKSSRDLSKKEQKRLCAEFTGYKHPYSSYSLADNLSPNIIKYYQNDQKTYFIENIINFAFNQALLCMKHNNTLSLINDMIPSYKKHMTSPFDAENGQDIINRFPSNNIIKALFSIKSVDFMTNIAYQEEVDRMAIFKIERDKESPEQKAQRKIDSAKYSVNFLDKLLNKSTEDAEAEKQKDLKELLHLKSVIKKLKSEIKPDQI